MKVTKRDDVAMKTLRAMGYNTMQLAEMFNVDHRTVSYHTNDACKENTKRIAREAYAARV